MTTATQAVIAMMRHVDASQMKCEHDRRTPQEMRLFSRNETLNQRVCDGAWDLKCAMCYVCELLGLGAAAFLPGLFFSRRHRFEQYLTSCQFSAHFLRQLNGRWQTGQVFVGKSCFFMDTGILKSGRCHRRWPVFYPPPCGHRFYTSCQDDGCLPVWHDCAPENPSTGN